MHKPIKKPDGWYVQTDDGESGPWATEAAAEAAADGDFYQANYLHQKEMIKRQKR